MLFFDWFFGLELCGVVCGWILLGYGVGCDVEQVWVEKFVICGGSLGGFYEVVEFCQCEWVVGQYVWGVVYDFDFVYGCVYGVFWCCGVVQQYSVVQFEIVFGVGGNVDLVYGCFIVCGYVGVMGWVWLVG